MTDSRPGSRIVLVALDASPHSLTALQTAARIASRLNAELRGVYVEDIDLLRTAALPFACAITPSGQSHPLTPEAMERQLRRQADMARNAVEAAGVRSHIAWSFSVVRGTVYREITRAASTAEFVTVGRLGWSARPDDKIGSVARALIESGTASLLMVERGGIQEPLAVLYDGSPASKRALSLISALDGRSDNPITVIVRRESPALQLEHPVPNARLEMVSNDPAEIRNALKRCGARTILVPTTAAAALAASGILELVNLSVFLVSASPVGASPSLQG